MDALCLMWETADMRSFGESVYSTDRYCYLLTNYNNVYAYLFWMKRTRESIVGPPLRNNERN